MRNMSTDEIEETELIRRRREEIAREKMQLMMVCIFQFNKKKGEGGIQFFVILHLLLDLLIFFF